MPAEYREAAAADARARRGGSLNVVEGESGDVTAPGAHGAAAPDPGTPANQDWWREQARLKQRTIDANHAFLRDLVAVERTLTFYPFLEPPAEVESLLSGLGREFATSP